MIPRVVRGVIGRINSLESTFSQYLGIDVTYTCAQDRSYTKATGYGCKSVLDRSQTVLKPTYSFLGTHRVTPGLSCALMQGYTLYFTAICMDDFGAVSIRYIDCLNGVDKWVCVGGFEFDSSTQCYPEWVQPYALLGA
jgi:hypothetical protein